MAIQERIVTQDRGLPPQNDLNKSSADTAHALTLLLLALLSNTARPTAPPASPWQGPRPETAMLGWNDTHVHLTAREMDVLRLVARGLTNAEIGTRLFISRRTVEQHLCSLFNKLGVSTRTAATHFAFQHHLC